MQLVIHPPVEAARLKQIEAAAGAMRVVNASDEREALAAMTDADAFFGKLTPELLQAAPKLKWVQSPTASLEHYVFPELIEHPAVLTNMRGLFSDVIAEQVFGYILCFSRNLHHYIRQQLKATWAPVGGEEARVGFVTGPGTVSAMDRGHQHLSDQTLGVVGFGAIGREIARKAKAFEMRVVAIDREAQPAEDGVEWIRGADRLDDLLEIADYVVIAAPHTPDTEQWFRRRQFERMRNDAILINIGRGAIVSLPDLDDALENGEIGGAALDVFEVEPLPRKHPLWTRENVIITPHVAGAGRRVPERHLETLLDNIRRFVAGQPLRNVTRKADWY